MQDRSSSSRSQQIARRGAPLAARSLPRLSRATASRVRASHRALAGGTYLLYAGGGGVSRSSWAPDGSVVRLVCSIMYICYCVICYFG